LLLTSTVVAGVVGFAVVSAQEPVFEAQAQLLVGPVNPDLDTIRAAGQNAQTYAELVVSKALLDETAKELGLSLAGVEVSASANEVTRFISVRVRDRDAEKAALVANRLADNLVALSQRTEARPEGELTLIDRAAVPTEPLQLNAVLMAFLAGLVGLVASFSLVLVVERLRSTVSSAEELAALAGTTVLARLPGAVRRRAHGELVVEEQPSSEEAVAYRMAAAEVELFGQPDGPLSSLLVLGAQAGDGAGEVAANLALALAAQGRRVTLVDANVEEGEATALLGLEGQLGMGELARHAELDRGEELLRHFRLPYGRGLDVLPRGVANGPELLDPERARLLVERLLSDSELVLVCAAAVQRSPGALAWARVCDACLLVAARDLTRRGRVTATVDSLRRAGANLIGAILRERGVRRRADGSRPRRRRAATEAVELEHLR
jgi:capsular polysaccharide biosynthesis protein